MCTFPNNQIKMNVLKILVYVFHLYVYSLIILYNCFVICIQCDVYHYCKMSFQRYAMYQDHTMIYHDVRNHTWSQSTCVSGGWGITTITLIK